MSREAVTRWLRLVEADAELSAYLIGVDRDRLAAHLARQLAARGPVLDGWPGLPEAQRRRAADYLAGVLSTRDHPVIDATTVPATDRWERRWRWTWALVERAAGRMGDGPAFWPAEVVGRDLAAEGIAILTVRPWLRLPFRPGQAVPVCVPQHPGRWRWYCPANAPRPDGTVELHVRAVPAGTVSHSLVHEVRPNDLLHLGPPVDIGLSMPAVPEPPPAGGPETASAKAAPAGQDGATARDLLLVAGGTGLAPLRALVEQVAAAPDGRRVTLIVGARTVADLYDAITLDKLDQAHPWLRVVPAFSHDPFVAPAEQGDALTVALDHYHPGQQVHVCGPAAMLDLARGRLTAAGIPADGIHLPAIW